MALLINPPPTNSPVDENGKKITTGWLKWIRRLFDTYSALIGTNGGANLGMPYAQFYDTTTQTAAGATSTAVTFNSTLLSNGVAIGSPTSKMVASVAGYYDVQFRFQTSNSSAAVDDFTCWIRKNGTDIANSASLSGAPAKHAAINGHQTVVANFTILLAVGDYLELYWTTDNGSTSILTFPASAVPPVHPQSPGVVCTFQYVSG